MSPIIITCLTLMVTMALFVWNRIPAAVVAVLSLLVLYFTGVLTMDEAVGGFGDPLIVFIAALLIIGNGLESTGVGTWAGQWLIRRAGSSNRMLIASLLILAAMMTSLIGMNGAVVTMLPIAVVVAARAGIPPSQVMMPVSIACLTGAKLTLLGSPVNVIVASAALSEMSSSVRFFEWAIVGIPLFIGALFIILVAGPWLLPERQSRFLPPDLSKHAYTLVEQYRIADELQRLRVRKTSLLSGKNRKEVDTSNYPGIGVIGWLDEENSELGSRPLAEGHYLLVRGDISQIGQFANDMHLAFCELEKTIGSLENTLFNRTSGLAEIAIPPRSEFIGKTFFPGMATHDGALIVLAIQRGGRDLPVQETELIAGDHLLLRGTWEALDTHLSDPQMLIVDSPQLIRQQAVALGQGAREALVILLMLVVLLATNTVPPVIAALGCVAAMVLTRVIKPGQLYNIDWNTCVLVGAMMPLATAMTKSGLANILGEYVIQIVDNGGPRTLLAGVFIMSAILTQVISNTSAALVMIPVAVATADDLGLAVTPLLIAVAFGAGAAHLTPMSTPVNMVTYGPGAYEFRDYWKIGILVLLWSLTVTVIITPWYWEF